MGIEMCLNAKVEQGKLTREQAEKALKDIKALERAHAQTMSLSAAEAAAAADVARDGIRAAKEVKRQLGLQILAQNRVIGEAGGHSKGWYAGVASLFARDWWARSGYSNVEARGRVILGELHGKWREGMAAYRSKALGLTRDTLGLTKFVRELYGEATGDAVAANAGRAFERTADYGVERFNAAGGALRAKYAWHLPQKWERALVQAAGKAGWSDFMHAALNDGRLKLIDWETGRPMDPLRANEIIDHAYDTITTGGLNDLTPGARGSGKVANSRLDHRAFEWTSADAWLDFNRKFGVGDSGIFDLVTGHFRGMSRDIALMEILGPNPDHTARVLIDSARKNGVGGNKLGNLEAIYDHVTGRASSPTSEFWANLGKGTRAWLQSSQLGSAMLSSTADYATLRATSKWNGIAASRVMARYLSMLNPANEADRILAVRSGLIAENWSRHAASVSRTQVEDIGPGLAGMAAEFVSRASGLAAHTEAGKWAFGMEYLGLLADHAGSTFDQLPREIRRGFQAYGLSPAHWEAIRARGIEDFGSGVKAVFPEKLAKSGDATAAGAANKLMELVLTEADFAIPTPGARERALMLGQTRPGSAVGELLRSTMQYKSFPVTLMTTHLMRGLFQATGAEKGRYLVGTAIGMTVMGALGYQLKQLAKGKDPQSMTDGKFWLAAFAQGGGAGILGDFLYGATGRNGQSFYMTLLGGPVGGLVKDIGNLTLGNIGQAARGENLGFGSDMARFVRSYTPGSSLWYTRLATDRLMFDQLQRMIDPNYPKSFARQEQRAQATTGQSFWWRPGAALPARAPDLGAMAGGAQ